MKLSQKQKINNLLNNLPVDRKCSTLLLLLYIVLNQKGFYRDTEHLPSVFQAIKDAIYLQEQKVNKSFNITDDEIKEFLKNYPNIDEHFTKLTKSLLSVLNYQSCFDLKIDDLRSDFFEAASYTDPAVFNVYCEDKFSKALIDYLCSDKKDCSIYFTDNSLISAESYAKNELKLKTTSIVNVFTHFDTALSPFVLKLLRALLFSLPENLPPPHECYEAGYKMDVGFSFSHRFYQLDNAYLETLKHNYREFLNKVDGRFVLFAPISMTFSNIIDVKDFRKDLIEQGYLDKVVRLPKYFVNNIDVSPVALIFDKHKECSSIDFINLDYKGAISDKESSRHHYVLTDDAIAKLNQAFAGDNSSICKKVSIEKIAKQNYSLDAAIQVTANLQEDTFTSLTKARVELSEIATTYRAQACAKLDDVDYVTKDNWYELNLADITETGIISEIAKSIEIVNGDPQVSRNKLKVGDIVLSVKGNVGKVGIIRDCLDNYMAGQCFAIIRSKDPIKYPPEAIFLQLKSDAIQEYIKAKTSGNTIKVLQSIELKKIPMLSLNEEQKAKAVTLVQELFEIENKMTELKAKIKDIIALSL